LDDKEALIDFIKKNYPGSADKSLGLILWHPDRKLIQSEVK
jgi:hypothetical protein